MRRATFLIVGICCLAQGVTASELEDYIAHVRKFRMTGDAESTLRTVAGYQIGKSSISFQRDEASVRYWPTFRSLSCPDPNATEEEQQAWSDRLASELEDYLLKVHPVVDTDGSGFVSDQEAAAFRIVVELGILAGELETCGKLNVRELADASGNSEERIRELMEEYGRVRADCDALGLVTPQLFGGMPDIALGD